LDGGNKGKDCGHQGNKGVRMVGSWDMLIIRSREEALKRAIRACGVFEEDIINVS
jgi:hypothetical protein